MKTEQKGISKALELVKFVWDNEKTDSYVRINSLMKDALKLAINAQFKFEKNDFENIFKSFSELPDNCVSRDYNIFTNK